MKIKLSKSQWEKMGKKAGWINREANLPNLRISLKNAINTLSNVELYVQQYQQENGAIQSKEQFIEAIKRMPGVVVGTTLEDWLWSVSNPQQTQMVE